jgi:hypothetical protein
MMRRYAPLTSGNKCRGRILRARYGTSGWLVRFIDETHGREYILGMRGMTDQREMLRLLNTDEQSLVHQWKESIK